MSNARLLAKCKWTRERTWQMHRTLWPVAPTGIRPIRGHRLLQTRTLRFGVLLPQHVCDKLMNNVALVLEVLVLAKTFSYNGESCQKGQGWNKGQTNFYTFKMFFNKTLPCCNCFCHLALLLFSSRLHFAFNKMSQLQSHFYTSKKQSKGHL